MTSSAIDLIVQAYVRVGDRRALIEMQEQWTRNVQRIEDRSDFDFTMNLDILRRDLESIGRGIADLQSVSIPTGSEQAGT
jgi:hypothetical protein